MNELEKQIEEMAREFCPIVCPHQCNHQCANVGNCQELKEACIKIRELGYRNCKDKVVLSKEEYEKMKSLYDTQKGAIMTSSIGDLPLTVEGLRKAVDEIARLIGVQIELQELNAKYYNEAKDLRRELAKINELNAKNIKLEQQSTARDIIHYVRYSFRHNRREFLKDLEKLEKEYGMEVE